jgi:hypothetical protein
MAGGIVGGADVGGFVVWGAVAGRVVVGGQVIVGDVRHDFAKKKMKLLGSGAIILLCASCTSRETSVMMVSTEEVATRDLSMVVA